MISSDRRATDRRNRASASSVNLGAVLDTERRERRDRREQPRRRTELRSIAQVEHRIRMPHPRLDVNVTAATGIRITAIFGCGCIASEPVGDGTITVNCAWCAKHAAPSITHERRKH